MATQRVPDAEALAHAAARAERLEALAIEVEQRAKDATGLCGPIEAAWLNEHIAESDGHLFALRWFNPFGPTHLEFVLKTVPARDVALLVANRRHPFSPGAWVVGRLAPEQRRSTDKLVALFREFARRALESASSWVNSTPTVVLRAKNGPLDWLAVKSIVRLLLDRVAAHDFERALDYMQRFPARPWDRAGAEFHDSFAQVAPHGEATTAQQAVANRAPVTDPLFDAWWACVTEAAHAGAEMAEFPRAWDGAIRFRAGEFSRTPDAEDGVDKAGSPGTVRNRINDEEVV